MFTLTIDRNAVIADVCRHGPAAHPQTEETTMTTTAWQIQATTPQATPQQLAAHGARWNDADACYDFPDGSAGRFCSPRAGVEDRDARGAVLVFRALEG